MQGSGNSGLHCFDINTTTGGGKVSVSTSGNSERNTVDMIGDASVSVSGSGNTNNLTLNNALL